MFQVRRLFVLLLTIFLSLVMSACRISGEDAIETEDVRIAFQGFSCTDTLSIFRSARKNVLYHPGGRARTFLVARFNVTNYCSEAVKIRTLMDVWASILGEGRQQGQPFVESGGLLGVRMNGQIESLQTQQICYLFEIPQSVLKRGITLLLNMQGRMFAIKSAPLGTFGGTMPSIPIGGARGPALWESFLHRLSVPKKLPSDRASMINSQRWSSSFKMSSASACVTPPLGFRRPSETESNS